nr:EOG090X0C5G [Megafenestra aurita]
MEVFVTQNDEKLNRKTDDDGDLVVQRKDFSPDLTLSIMHYVNTSLELVGLQVWRGALLLADYLLHLATDNISKSRINHDDAVIELGAGTGFTSIVAGMAAGQVVSTDIAMGNILSLIDTNIKQNSRWIKAQMNVKELNFYDSDYSVELTHLIENSTFVIAADVVYHDDLTDAFILTLKRLMNIGRQKIALIALEKRFVFTLSDLDVGAPCYEYFYDRLHAELSSYNIIEVDTNRIPQYFCYERVKELVLFEIHGKNT